MRLKKKSLFDKIIGKMAGKILEWWPSLEVKPEVDEQQFEDATLALKDIESPRFPFSGGKFTIKYGGILPPHMGDGLFVIINFYLPSDGKELADHLCFGERIPLSHKPLVKMWGLTMPGNSAFVYSTENFSQGDTWEELFKHAWKYAYSDMNQLEQALIKRQHILKKAESKN